jgi:pSer/pThr/pTyr-binding forkhead associated (FHA) protein
VTTCTRCGKENQDHYKFCLGCGNEIKAAPKVEAKPVSRDAQPLETARTMLQSDAGARPAGFSAMPNTPPPVSAGRSKGGIPWNDSPKMPGGAPAIRATSPSTAPGTAPGLAGAVTPPPVSSEPGARAAPETTAMDVPPAPWNQSRAVAGSLSTTAQVGQAGGSDGAGSAAASGVVICPNCGRTVTAGFTFCGSCGTRIAPAGGSSAIGPKTMHTGGSAAVVAPVPRGRIILIRPDGSEGGAHPLHDGENLVGRGQGHLFEGDLYLSPRHAEFHVGPDGLIVRDLRSLNGVFVKIESEEALESGDVIRVGQELLRFEIISPPAPLEDGTEVAGTPNPGFWGRLSVIVGRDVDGSAFPLFGDAIVMGRERGDILFPEDGYVSGTHARISLRDGRVYLVDVGSSNGTFLRVRGDRKVSAGAFILMGQQLFRAEYR